jgi:hypothetical protein
MPRSDKKRKAQAAWARIEALGGHRVWDCKLVVVSFSDSEVTHADLTLFQDFPYVQILDLSRTKISDKGLSHLEGLHALEELIVTDTKISAKALKGFQQSHPLVKVTKGPPLKGTINPFTGKPF